MVKICPCLLIGGIFNSDMCAVFGCFVMLIDAFRSMIVRLPEVFSRRFFLSLLSSRRKKSSGTRVSRKTSSHPLFIIKPENSQNILSSNHICNALIKPDPVQLLFLMKFQISDEKLDRCITFGDIFLVLYSITDRSSFKEAGRIARYIRKKKTLDSTSLAIAGTKRDLAHRRQVEEADGNRLTTSTNCSFYEISISENFSDTHDMIHDILRQYLSSHRPNEGPTATTGSSMEPSSPLSTHKEIKPSSSSSWARLKRTPFRRKSVQTAVC